MQKKRHQRIAVIGGGVCGLTAALRMAEHECDVEVFEAAPAPGGRTRSFLDKKTGEWCDNGPHLLNGAYQATIKLMNDCQASQHITWQPSLKLPLWDQQRRFFNLAPSSRLPFPIAMLLAVATMPGHGWRSALAMLHLNQAVKNNQDATQNIAELMQQIGAPHAYIRDMIEPICLGSMNESMDTANSLTFGRVLSESFASATAARLGWFNVPIQQALIEPLIKQVERAGAIIYTRHPIRSIRSVHKGADTVILDDKRFDATVIALPAYARNRLFGIDQDCETRSIMNIHLWYENHPGLPEPFIGGIGTTGQWFFDVSSQINQTNPPLRHLCAVISAGDGIADNDALVKQINHELSLLCNTDSQPSHVRIVHEKRATILVRPHHDIFKTKHIIDASESPEPGELPATIEFAIQRGEKAALNIINP